MKTQSVCFGAFLCFLSYSALGEAKFTGQGFNNAGVFHMTVSSAGDLEVSTNLSTWTKFAAVSQETTLDDVASRRMDWRFFRTHGSGQGDVVGYVKVAIPAGKVALVGNPFLSPIHLETPEGRRAVFGSTNPAVRVSLHAGGKFAPHTLDSNTGAWTPAIRAIRAHEGFSVENLGANQLVLHFSGNVHQGAFNTMLPAGATLVVPPAPQVGSVAEVFGLPGKDGMQIEFFNEDAQKYLTSTFDSLENGWLPKLPEYRPGRAIIFKTPQGITWTKGAPAAAK